MNGIMNKTKCLLLLYIIIKLNFLVITLKKYQLYETISLYFKYIYMKKMYFNIISYFFFKKKKKTIL